jgi:Sel1 repeat
MAWSWKSLRNHNTSEHVTSAGHLYRWHYKPRRPARSELSISANLPVDFCIAKENRFHRFAKRLGFASEFQTGDAEFDATYYIESDDPSLWHALGSADVRRSVYRIFAIGDTIRVAARRDRLTVAMAIATPDPDPYRANEIVRELLVIESRIAGALFPDGARSRTLARRANVASSAIAVSLVAALIAWVALPYRLIATGPMVEAALLFALVPIVSSLFLIRMLFAGSARGASVLGIFLLCGVAGAAVATCDVLYAANFYYDTSESAIAIQQIDGTEFDSGRNPRFYLLTADPSRPERTLRLPWGSSVDDRIHRGDEIRIEVHPGRLGFPWIEGYEVYFRTAESFERVAVDHQRKCDGGSLDDCLALGRLYHEGQGVPRDEARAADLLRRACDGAKCEACSDLGVHFENGLGVEADHARAAHLYDQACSAGVPVGCSNLAGMLIRGRGIPADWTRARELYESACAAGIASACESAGRLERAVSGAR